MLYLKKVSTVQNSESNDPFFNLVKSKNIYIVAALWLGSFYEMKDGNLKK